jgi:hypothetical protein
MRDRAGPRGTDSLSLCHRAVSTLRIIYHCFLGRPRLRRLTSRQARTSL